jgi:hypothetical protein
LPEYKTGSRKKRTAIDKISSAQYNFYGYPKRSGEVFTSR